MSKSALAYLAIVVIVLLTVINQRPIRSSKLRQRNKKPAKLSFYFLLVCVLTVIYIVTTLYAIS